MTYIVEIKQYGNIVKVERVASADAARQIAQEWRARGFYVRVTDEHNASLPY